MVSDVEVVSATVLVISAMVLVGPGSLEVVAISTKLLHIVSTIQTQFMVLTS